MTSSGQRDITIMDARDDDGELVRQFYRTILARSFPEDELDAEQALLDAVDSGLGRILLATDGNGTVLGGAVGDYFARPGVMLLSYLAAGAATRGSGVGSALLNAAITNWTSELKPRLLVLEVEDPRYFHGSAAYGDPVARARFYERFGAKALEIPYFQPALRPDTKRIPRLMLMVLAGTDLTADTTRVDGTVVAGFLADYFRSSEGEPRADDAELTGLLASCARPDGVPLVAVGDLPAFAEWNPR